MTTLLRFTAKWCGPCKMLAPLIATYEDKATIRTIDVDEEPKVAVEYKVTAIPTVIVLDENGKETDRKVGQAINKTFLDKVTA